jgi:hypothetical protein
MKVATICSATGSHFLADRSAMLRKLHLHVPAEYHESGLNARGIQDRNQRSGGGGGTSKTGVTRNAPP